MKTVALGDEQQQLTAMVDRLVAGAIAAPRAGEPVAFEPRVWREIVNAGLVDIGLSESAGGGTAVDAALVVEALARGPLAAPYLGSLLALALLDAADNLDAGARRIDELKEQIVGGRSAAVLLSEDLGELSTVGVTFDAAHDCIVLGWRDGRLFTAETSTPLDCVDLTRRLTNSHAHTLLATASSCAVTRWLAFALVMLSADLLGAMEASLTEATRHANERIQFGRPVGSFQAVQHLCADQLVTVESARSSLWYAAWAADALDPSDALAAARVAKAYCSESAIEVCEAAIQVWGGVGMTWECRAHLFLRRALLSRQVLGDEHRQLSAIARELLDSERPPDESER